MGHDGLDESSDVVAEDQSRVRSEPKADLKPNQHTLGTDERVEGGTFTGGLPRFGV